jgi:hypothetical protein
VSAATVETASSGLVGQNRLLISGLTLGTEYAFRLAAVNAIGTGDFASYTPTVIPAGANSFTAYIDDNFSRYDAWRNTIWTRESVQINGRAVFSYTVLNWNDYTVARPVIFNFIAHIVDGTAESNICSYPYNLNNCLYTYDYQMQVATGEPVIQDWVSVSTPAEQLDDIWTYPGTTIQSYSLPELPQTLVFVPYINGRSLATDVTYWARCVVTRKSDNMIVATPPVRLLLSEDAYSYGGD